MIKKQDLTAVILVGGKSSRFGSPKEFAHIRMESLLDNAINIAKKISSSIMIISGNEHFIVEKDIPIYQDLYKNCGPVCGIYTALYYADSPYIAVLPCDMPLLDPEIYKLFRTLQVKDCVIVAIFHGKIQPLISIWPKTMAKDLKKMIDGKILSLKKILDQLKVQKIDLLKYKETNNPDIFYNINYKGDLERLKNR